MGQRVDLLARNLVLERRHHVVLGRGPCRLERVRRARQESPGARRRLAYIDTFAAACQPTADRAKRTGDGRDGQRLIGTERGIGADIFGMRDGPRDQRVDPVIQILVPEVRLVGIVQVARQRCGIVEPAPGVGEFFQAGNVKAGVVLQQFADRFRLALVGIEFPEHAERAAGFRCQAGNLFLHVLEPEFHLAQLRDVSLVAGPRHRRHLFGDLIASLMEGLQPGPHHGVVVHQPAEPVIAGQHFRRNAGRAGQAFDLRQRHIA